jgi:hypothetical protein
VAVVFDAGHRRPVVHTQIQDLSIIGAAIHTEHGDLTGTVVTLLLAYPSRKASEIPKALKVRARVLSSVRTPDMPHYRHGLSFIRSHDDGVDDLEEILHAASTVAHRGEPYAADTGATLDAPAAGGRLAQLKQLADAKRAEGKTADAQDEINASVSDALGIAYRYLKDLTEQLNVINPAYRKGYSIPGVREFNRLSWEVGRADFRSREITPIFKLYDRVSLRFQLSGKKQIRVARECPASEKLRQWLADCKIEFNEHDGYNARGAIERTTFVFPCEVKASVMLFGQYDMGKLLLRTSNVSGFGAMDQILAPEAVTDESLDELTGFILGESSRLGPLLLRNA